MALVQDDKRVNLSEPIHITTNGQKTGLEILKEEAQYKDNFKGVDETIDASCSYDHLIRFCESKYGKIETWDYIEGLFKDADERLQHDLIDCCGWRYDVETDAQRVRILKNVASNGVLNNNYLIYYAATAIHGDLDHVQLPVEAMKEILSRLNPDQYDYAVHHISNDVIGLELVEKYENAQNILEFPKSDYAKTLDFFKKRTLKNYTKEEIINVFRLFLKHECATEEAKQTVKKLLKEVTLV